jgi:hypothetical protein
VGRYKVTVYGREVSRDHKMHLIDEYGVFCGAKVIPLGVTPERLNSTSNPDSKLVCERCKKVKYTPNPARAEFQVSQGILDDLVDSGKVTIRYWS